MVSLLFLFILFVRNTNVHTIFECYINSVTLLSFFVYPRYGFVFICCSKNLCIFCCQWN